MSPTLRRAFERELVQFAEKSAARELDAAWKCLERAHVLSQGYAVPHVRVHGAMFWLAVRRGDVREILGQIPRLLLAGPASLLGRAPRGNTGGSNVGILTPMAIPSDLEEILRHP